jgi:flagellar motor switch protein FliM
MANSSGNKAIQFDSLMRKRGESKAMPVTTTEPMPELV